VAARSSLHVGRLAVSSEQSAVSISCFLFGSRYFAAQKSSEKAQKKRRKTQLKAGPKIIKMSYGRASGASGWRKARRVKWKWANLDLALLIGARTQLGPVVRALSN